MSTKNPSETVDIRMISRAEDLLLPDFPCISLLYVCSGDCRIRLGQESVTLEAQQLLLFDETDYALTFTGPATVLAVFVGLDYFQQHTFNTIWREPFFSEFILWIFDRQLRCFTYALFPATEENRLDALLLALYREQEQQALCAPNAMDSYLLLIFIQLAREYAGEYGKTAWNKHLEYGKLIHYLNDNYRTATLESTAAFFHFSPAYISKFLKKTTGKSFIEYIQQQRMTAAEHVLKNSDMPARSIARQVGYQNVSYFYRVFEKYHGCTPVEYRQREFAKKDLQNVT